MVHDYLFDIHIEEVLEKNDLSFFFSEEGVHKHAVIAIEYNEGQTPPFVYHYCFVKKPESMHELKAQVNNLTSKFGLAVQV